MKPFQQACPDHIVLPSGLTEMEKPRRIVGSRIQRAVPALEDSYMANKQHMVMDAALVRGRACRVGWGPGMSLVHCGLPINKKYIGEEGCCVLLHKNVFRGFTARYK